ncbi:protein FRIGIDA-ESSENTIAL 1-like [Brassica napus]|uniref:protein FRIGIDA-ESSENTIAL 1-like n=1 Tax=Brassica napus TaxID=3708 RepID=UPI000BBE22B4|nr:protein FRIGIDA-ESSENTIAL 1-like [Brassica napus]
MSDSDMDIDDDDVQVQVQRTIAGDSGLLLAKPSDSQSRNDVKKHLDENSGKNNTMLGEAKDMLLSRFPAPAPSFPLVNGPEQKRAALPCKFFGQGWCDNGISCRFLHVKENTNGTSQQQWVNHMAGASGIQSVEGENGVASLVNPSGDHEIRFMPSLGNMERGSLPKGGAVFTEDRHVFVNSTSSFPLKSSFVQEHGASLTSYGQTDMGSSGPAWTGSLFSSTPMNQYASKLGNCENINDINGSGSPPMVEAISVSSVQDTEGDRTSNNKKVYSHDWEPSEPFRASFTIPPYILPSSDALYDPFTDIENPQDRSLTAPLSSKGRYAQKKSSQQKDDESASDNKNSSCSNNQYQESMATKNLEAHGVVEGVATSVVDQNDETTPSKEVSAENRSVLKRSKPAGHGSWRRSDGSSHQKVLKSDERDGEARSDAGTKALRQFRTAVVETIKEMVKPLWREGRLTKEVHNMVVKRASEKIVSAAVQSHQVPTDSASVDQYLSMSATKIVKLVEASFFLDTSVKKLSKVLH